MNILLVEEPDKHSEPIFDRMLDIYQKKVDEVNLAETIEDALSFLQFKKYDIIIIHHEDWTAIELLKEIYPKPKYFGYSQFGDVRNPKGTFGGDFARKMLEIYDDVIGDLQYTTIIEHYSKII